MKRSRIIIALAAVLLAVAVILSLAHNSKLDHQAHPPAREHGSSTTTVGLNDTGRLSEILLPEEFSAVKRAVSNYIHSNVGASVTSANILPGSTKLNDDGSITFDVAVDKPEKTFNILLTRPSALEIDFLVTGSGLPSVALFPFSNPL